MTIHQSSSEAFTSLSSLGFLAPPDAVPLSGDIETWGNVLFSTADGASLTGFWESEEGQSLWSFDRSTEVIYILSGTMIVTEEGGAPVELTAGDAAVFPKGWKGHWNITERLRKLYVVFP